MATVFFGPMGAGKSTELYRQACRAALVPENRVVVVMPCNAQRSASERAGDKVIYTHSGLLELNAASDNAHIVYAHGTRFDCDAVMAHQPTHVYVEELQFFDAESLCSGVATLLRRRDCDGSGALASPPPPPPKVALFGLRTDCEGRLWTTSAAVLRIADRVKTLSAVCGAEQCRHNAHYTALRCGAATQERFVANRLNPGATNAAAAAERPLPTQPPSIPAQGCVPGGMQDYVPLCFEHMQRYLERTGGDAGLASAWPLPPTRDP